MSETKTHGAGWSMKTLKISENAHRELTRWLGQMMAQSGKAKTYSDVIEALVSQALLLSPELVKRVDEFIEANKHLGYETREEFIREVITETLSKLSEASKRTRKKEADE